MSIFELVMRGKPRADARYLNLLLPVFACAIFVSATLLFSVQPMFTKMVLPLLGGAPAVWSVAMVFFQGILLLGYAYAHVLSRLLDPRRAVLVHLLVVAGAFATLPIAVAGGFGKPPADYAAFWLIGLFSASIGLPFFAVAANAPMLQAWFARTGHIQARDPYFLYGASNLGSFASLLAYPVLIEPFLTLREQSGLWSAGFVVLALLIAAAGTMMTLAMRLRGDDAVESAAIVTRAPSWPDRFKWLALAFVPSALLIAVTSHISTDIAAAPFLWVVPLALFLATFVFTFRKGGDRLHYWMVRLQPYIVAPLVIGLMSGERSFWLVAILLNLGVFVVSTMICHRELYLRRPDVSHLTEFYMWMSLGGVLGGIFSGLVAPFVFPDVFEYPILIVLALLCRPGAFSAGWRAWFKQGAFFAGAMALVLVTRVYFGFKLPDSAALPWMIVLVLIAGAIMLQSRQPIRLVGLCAFVLILTAAYRPGVVETETERSFFGVHKIMESADGRFRMLFHGTTLHGAQRIRDDSGRPTLGRPVPVTYYHAGGAFAEMIRAVRESKGALPHVAVIGLGSGSLACHSRAGEQWTYYEIDPVVVEIARDPSKFRFLSDCAPGTDIVLGDARLTLAESKQRYDLIVLDAFSSDVVPVHLMTQEALSLYMSKLAPGSAVAFHVSNRYLELASVVGEVAAAQGLVAYVKRDEIATAETMKTDMIANALLVVVARRPEDVARLPALGWTRYRPTGSVRPWTDDYSNILAAIWRMRYGARESFGY